MIGVATRCFKKFGFNGLINLLVSLGLSASYDLQKKCSLVNTVQMGSRWGVGMFKECVSSLHQHNTKWLFHCVYINPYCHWKVQINESERLCCDIWPAIVLEGSGYCCLCARTGQYCCKTCWFPSLDLKISWAVPITTTMDAAPETLLHMINCKCKTGCTSVACTVIAKCWAGLFSCNARTMCRHVMPKLFFVWQR